MKRKDFPRVTPTPHQLVSFAASQHSTLLTLTFEGPCPALAEGDRVVVVAGKHKEMNGFIAVLRELWNGEKHRKIEYTKVVLPGDGGAYHIKKQDKGAHVELTHLKRAGLDFGYKFLVNDRVRVVSGILYKGATGRVMDVANDRLTISIPNDFDVVGPTTASAVSPHIKLFTIEIGHVSRVWYLGDSVRVRWDEHKGRTGVIVASNVGGILEIFDVCTFLLSLPGYKLTPFWEGPSHRCVEQNGRRRSRWHGTLPRVCVAQYID
jgi:ribosomal protein L24